MQVWGIKNPKQKKKKNRMKKYRGGMTGRGRALTPSFPSGRQTGNQGSARGQGKVSPGRPEREKRPGGTSLTLYGKIP